MLNVNRQTSNDGKCSNGLWLGELEKGNLKKQLTGLGEIIGC
jgi:hypothetical protein